MLGANQPACAQTRHFPRPGTLDATFETLHEGDSVELDGEPGRRTTRVRIEGPLRGETPGVDLAALLLRIWLGSSPVSDDLRAAMPGS